VQIRKSVAGIAVAGALGAAGLGLAGTASAAPGISIDPGTNGENTIGIGDQSKTGATAKAKPGNTSVAISIFAPATADASEGGSTTFGEGNNVLAIGSDVKTGPNSAGNNVIATGGATVRVNGHHNNVLAVAGDTRVVKAAKGDNIVRVCNVTISGQADSITPSLGGC
jgi:hypothetical protein